MSMTGKVVAITGAASGIGRATAELLASEGALLSLCDRNADGLQATLESLSGPAGSHITMEVDVSSAPAVNKWIERTVQHFGKLDGAVNSAGVCPVDPVPIRVATDERWDHVMSVNTTGIFYSLRAQLQQMQSGGSIVNVASIAGHVGLAGSASYVASKHAVIGLTKTAAREEGDAGIRVNCVTPGAVHTPLTDPIPNQMKPLFSAQQCMKRWAEPQEIAKVIVFLLSEQASFVTGASYSVDGGWVC